MIAGRAFDVLLASGLYYASGDAFDVITYGARAGDFAVINVPAGSNIEYANRNILADAIAGEPRPMTDSPAASPAPYLG